MITRGATIWGSGTLALSSATMIFGSIYFSSPVLPGMVYLLLTVMLFVSLVILILSLRPTAPVSPNTANYREAGWDVEVSGAGTSRLAEHVLDISELAGQEIKPLYRVTKYAEPNFAFVIALIQTPATFVGNSGYHLDSICTIVQGVLPARIEGWISVKPTEFLEQSLGQDIDLESIEFNRLFEIKSSSTKQAFLGLAPNLMSWFMDLPRGVWLHIEGNQVSLVFTRDLSPNEITAASGNIRRLVDLVKHGGALEKNP